MYKKLPLISSLAVAAVFLAVSPVKMTKAQEKTIETLSPVGGWSAQAMAADTKNGYCALSRKYSDGMVLTLGQNVMEEYSLAIDYQNQNLDMDKAYKVTLQPGPGQIRAYEMMPASQRAMVLRLGYDDSFIASLETSGVLKVQIDGKNNHFQISDFKAAQKKLSDCMASLTGKPEVQIASDFSAEKVENAEPMKLEAIPKEKTKKTETPEVVIVKEKAPVEEVVEVVPKVAVAPKIIEIAKVATKEVQVASNIAEVKNVEKEQKLTDAQALKAKIEAEEKLAEEKAVKAEAEAKKLTEIETEKKSIAEKQAQELLKKQAELKKAQELQKIALEKKKKQEEVAKLAEEEKVRKEREVAEAKTKAEEEAKKQKELAAAEKLKVEKEEKKRQEVAATEAENAKKLAEVNAQKDAEKKAVEIRQEADRIAKEQIEKAKQVEDSKIVKEQEEKEKASIIPMETAALAQPNPKAFTERVDVKTQQELKETQERLKALEQENRQLYLEARKAQGAIDSVVVETGNQALKKIREYERKLEAAQADNLVLSREVEEMRKLQENGRLDAVSGDATLEQSTKRYNESEREIKRLGLLLEQQRNAHRLEKQELEQMLFDPAVTEDSQRKRLAELEAKLAAAEAKVQQSTEPLLQQKIQTEKEAELAKQRVVELEKQKAIEDVRPKGAEAAKQNLVDIEKQKAIEDVRRKEAELKLKQEQIRLKEMEIKLEQAEKKLSAMDNDVVEFKVVPSTSSAPTIVNLDKRESEVFRENSGKVSAPPSYSASRPSISRESNSKERTVKVAPDTSVLSVEAKRTVLPVQIENAPTGEANVVKKQTPSITFDEGEIRDVLIRAGVGFSGAISNQGEGRYSWKSGELNGRAQVVPIQRAGSLDQFVQTYIGQAERSCNGDFASLPATNITSGKGFEIACIGANQGTSSSVIFKQRGAEIIAISHQASAENMDVAMDARDRIAGSL